MNVFSEIWAGQIQQFIVALHALLQVFKARPPVKGFAQFQELNLRAHGAVKEDNALGQQIHQTPASGVRLRTQWSGQSGLQAMVPIINAQPNDFFARVNDIEFSL